MGCDGCDLALQNPEGLYAYRIGNKKVGWGNIAIIACKEHAKLAIDRLNMIANHAEKAELEYEGEQE